VGRRFERCVMGWVIIFLCGKHEDDTQAEDIVMAMLSSHRSKRS
jgi:hypothetical protein